MATQNKHASIKANIAMIVTMLASLAIFILSGFPLSITNFNKDAVDPLSGACMDTGAIFTEQEAGECLNRVDRARTIDYKIQHSFQQALLAVAIITFIAAIIRRLASNNKEPKKLKATKANLITALLVVLSILCFSFNQLNVVDYLKDDASSIIKRDVLNGHCTVNGENFTPAQLENCKVDNHLTYVTEHRINYISTGVTLTLFVLFLSSAIAFRLSVSDDKD